MRGSTWGFLAAVVLTAIVAGMLLWAATTSTATSVLDVEQGDCFRLDLDDIDIEIVEVDVIDCADPHNAEVIAVGLLNDGGGRDYPADDVMFGEIERRCADDAAAAGDRFGVLPVAPNEASWEPFEGRFACVALPIGGDPVKGSIVVAP